MTHHAPLHARPPMRHRWLAAWRFALGLGALWCAFAWSADTYVAPGGGTLAAAIAAASPGDTLILQDGAYSGATVTKSLTIRPFHKGTLATVSGTNLTIDAASGDVTIQGLELATTLVVNRAANVNILENQLHNVDILVSNYKTSEGDGKLVIVGNWLHDAGSIGDIYSDNAYVAGNRIDNGRIGVRAPAWLVGNVVNYSGLQNEAINVATGGSVQIIGNRIFCYLNANHVYGIRISSSSSVLIAGNIVFVGSSYPSAYTSVWIYGIYAESAVFALVSNNVIRVASANTANYGVGISAYGQIQGNIVNWFNYQGISGSGVDYNLCTGSSTPTCGAHALKSDPKFIDAVDFKLAADSPAIDAGPDSPLRADTDRTRNDMGAYGGPWPISVYDAQRDAGYTGPYVYPLFDASRSIQDLSTLQVRALAIARFR